MSVIRIVAEILLKPGCRQDLMPIFHALTAGSRAEAGNVEYELTEHLENPDHLFVIETWASADAIAEHAKMPHFLAYRKAIEGKVEHMAVNRLKKLL